MNTSELESAKSRMAERVADPRRSAMGWLVGGWGLLFAGHAVEGNRPAILSDPVAAHAPARCGSSALSARIRGTRLRTPTATRTGGTVRPSASRRPPLSTVRKPSLAEPVRCATHQQVVEVTTPDGQRSCARVRRKGKKRATRSPLNRALEGSVQKRTSCGAWQLRCRGTERRARNLMPT
jgi:hypothetical protein